MSPEFLSFGGEDLFLYFLNIISELCLYFIDIVFFEGSAISMELLGFGDKYLQSPVRISCLDFFQLKHFYIVLLTIMVRLLEDSHPRSGSASLSYLQIVVQILSIVLTL